MKFGASVSSYTTTWDEISGAVATMESGRWESIWFPDHFIPPAAWKGAEDQPIFESWSLLAAVAGMTTKLRMGHMVSGNTYRNPGLVAKMATTIDQISRGRFILSVGAAWFKREHEAYGWDFPSLGERSNRFEEACQLIHELFTATGPVDFNGKYYTLDKAPLSPASVQNPHIPIMVGGMGEKRTLRTLAKYGDIWNLDGFAVGKEENERYGGMSLQLYKHKVEVIEKHCEEVGRDPSEIKYTISMPIKLSENTEETELFIDQVGSGTVAGTADYIIHRVGEFIEAGVDEIMFSPRPSNSDSLQRLDEEVLSAFD
jgi:alkanesulfonate monooxygenase SsuD/methylene tetrahydromethanopterin reductase-like flavin-dependent oxidoreductase (luciferase family)|tara:strand:- start:6763 stop:7707 length:945 start_codon:yes stop_codon:yes gene_type:complete